MVGKKLLTPLRDRFPRVVAQRVVETLKALTLPLEKLLHVRKPTTEFVTQLVCLRGIRPVTECQYVVPHIAPWRVQIVGVRADLEQLSIASKRHLDGDFRSYDMHG